MRALAAHLVGVLLALTMIACTADAPEEGPPPDSDIETLYPDLAALYAGEAGIYRGCGPNGGVCHNDRMYPDLSTLGSIVDLVGEPCNQLRDKPSEVHDWCERTGDEVDWRDQRIEVGWIQPQGDETPPRRWRMRLEDPVPAGPMPDGFGFYRPSLGTPEAVFEMDIENVTAVADDPNAVDFDLAVPVLSPEEDPEGLASAEVLYYLTEALRNSGIPGNPNAVQFGDPNANGIFGAVLGKALISPGAPQDSYLIQRLIDPSMGTIMPLANCCYWTKSSLRALWCWIAGLSPDGANALDTIDYASCPPGPTENVMYPTPGPMCESSGMCPVQVRTEGMGGFAGVLAIMRRSCAGSDCHIGSSAGDFAIPDDPTAAHDALSRRVVPGDPEASLLYQRVRPECDAAAGCTRMPLGAAPLPDPEIAVIRDWIVAGAAP